MPRPVLRTSLCDLLGIEYPVLLAGMGPVAGGMGGVATAELAAAVSNAGGLGVLGGAGWGAERLREEIQKVRSLTNKPFGVDLLLPSNFMGGAAMGELPPDPRELIPAQVKEGMRKIAADLGVEYVEMPRQPLPAMARSAGAGMSDSQMEVVIEEEVPVFASGLGNPAPFCGRRPFEPLADRLNWGGRNGLVIERANAAAVLAFLLECQAEQGQIRSRGCQDQVKPEFLDPADHAEGFVSDVLLYGLYFFGLGWIRELETIQQS